MAPVINKEYSRTISYHLLALVVQFVWKRTRILRGTHSTETKRVAYFLCMKVRSLGPAGIVSFDP